MIDPDLDQEKWEENAKKWVDPLIRDRWNRVDKYRKEEFAYSNRMRKWINNDLISVRDRTQDPNLTSKVEAEIKHRELQYAIKNKEGDVQSNIQQLRLLHHQNPFLQPLSYEQWAESFNRTSLPPTIESSSTTSSALQFSGFLQTPQPIL